MTPIYEYTAADTNRSCAECRGALEVLQRMSDPPLKACPKCGAPVQRLISAPAVGASKTGFDQRAKSAGFHKLKRTGRGEYEKQF